MVDTALIPLTSELIKVLEFRFGNRHYNGAASPGAAFATYVSQELLRGPMLSVIDGISEARAWSSQAQRRRKQLFVRVHFHKAVLGAELDTGRICL